MTEDSITAGFERIRKLSRAERETIAVTVAFFVGLTVQVFVRARSGIRQLRPAFIIGMAAVLFLWAAAWNAFVPVESVAVEPVEQSNNARGYDAPLPENWQRMTNPQRLEWQEEHRMTPEQQQAMQQQLRAEMQQRVKDAQAATERRAMLHIGPMTAYALAFLMWGLWQYRQRWQEFKSGVLWHTRSRGLSYVAPMTSSALSEANTLRWVDPLIVALIGWVVLQFSRPLGWWLVLAAFAFYIIEQYHYERAIEAIWDMGDMVLDADARQQNMRYYRKKPTDAPEQEERTSLSETGGVLTTGAIDPKLAELYRQRYQEAQDRLRQMDEESDNDMPPPKDEPPGGI